MNTINTFTVQTGLDEALKLGDYVELRALPLIVSAVTLALTPRALRAILQKRKGESTISVWRIFTAFNLILTVPLVSIVLLFMFTEHPKITDEDRLTNDIISKSHDDYLSKEIIREAESEGWKLDCPDSSDSILCGGKRLDTPVPVHKDNGESAHIAVSFSYQDFFRNNEFDAVEAKLGDGVIKPGEPLAITVELEKVSKESEQPAQLTLNPFVR